MKGGSKQNINFKMQFNDKILLLHVKLLSAIHKQEGWFTVDESKRNI